MNTTVLIIEDEAYISDLLKMYLAKEGYNVETAADGSEGLLQFRTKKPDLVLLDLMLPVVSGWDVCKAIRAESQTPIIMLTAKSETEDKVMGLKLGADDYITKPFEMPEVLARIEAILRRSEPAQQETTDRRLVFDKLTIDMDAFELIVDGKKWTPRPRKWDCSFSLPPLPTGSTPAISF